MEMQNRRAALGAALALLLVWCAASTDGFTWEEQGAAIQRFPRRNGQGQ